MTTRASGPFTVKMSPQPRSEGVGDPIIGRMSLAKQFSGDLEATSLGEMLAIRTDIAGSAGYVAMERVVGRLLGREGSFSLQHSGTMDRGVPRLTVTVVPDSGTGGLVGLTGKMEIHIESGEHSYTFEFVLSGPT